MEEHRFLISEAARMVAVEAHVLRYWEEELDIPVGRTELGHRYYTRENIETFQKVKKLKEEGLQLKAIRLVLKGAKRPGMRDAAYGAAHDAPRNGAAHGALRDGATHGALRDGAAHDSVSGWDTQNSMANNGAAYDAPRNGTTYGAPRDVTDESQGRWNTQNDATDNGAPKNGAPKNDETTDTSVAVIPDSGEKLRQFMDLVESIVEKVVKDNNEDLQKRLEEAMARETDYILHMQEKREEEHFRRLDEAIRERQKNGRYVAASREKKSWWDRLWRKK